MLNTQNIVNRVQVSRGNYPLIGYMCDLLQFRFGCGHPVSTENQIESEQKAKKS